MKEKSRLEKKYREEIVEKLQKQFDFKNKMRVPRISKVVLNVGAKDAVADSKVLNLIKDIVEDIANQAAVRTYARKSVAGFKLREGMPIGIRVTLRREKMYHFLDKLINVALPRVRDFHGIKNKCDGNGNFNLGIKDWMIFPEVNYDKVDKVRGLNITIQTTARSDEEAIALLNGFNMPFIKK